MLDVLETDDQFLKFVQDKFLTMVVQQREAGQVIRNHMLL